MAFGFIEDGFNKLVTGDSESSMFSSAMKGAAIGMIGGPAGIVIGGYLGAQRGMQKDAQRAQQKAYEESEAARVRGVMRDYMSQKQTMDTIAAGFDRPKVGKSRGSALPDPIAETSGYMGEGLSQIEGSSTSGTF